MAKKMFHVLENNPEVMNHLAQTLGLSPTLAFHDIYSLTDPDLLSFLPRPIHALLVIIPLTPAWKSMRESEDETQGTYTGSGPSEPVLWFKQTIGHACGSIELLHCLLNGEAANHIIPGSTLDEIRKAALPLQMAERAKVLEDSAAFEAAHEEAAKLGDTRMPGIDEEDSHYFVAFVKGKDGGLYELKGARKGPIDRGLLKEDEDVLSERALELGFGKVVNLERESGGGDLRFSAIGLGESL